MPWLIIVLVVLAVLIGGGIIARKRQLASSRPAFERALAQVEQDLVAAAASDRGWDRSVLEAAAREAGVGYRKTITRCAPEDFSTYLAYCARTIDLSLVPIRPYDEMHEKVVEGLIFQSGRPLLIFSGGGADRLSSSFEHAAIAWDHSQQATRAVADAMWLLQSVKTVRVFTATDNETSAERECGEALVKHLAAHGIKAGFEVIAKSGVSIGKVFEAYVQNSGIDLLVMGAYRHSRLREFFMPGATYTVVGAPPCWVLMSH